MKKTVFLLTIIFAFFVFTSAAFGSSTQTLTPDQEVKVMNLSIPWVQNVGQISDQSVKFSAATLIGNVFITKDGAITYSLIEKKNPPQPSFTKGGDESPLPLAKGESERDLTATSVVIKETPLYKLTPKIIGIDPSPTKTNYFLGNDSSKWKSNVSTYSLVSYGYIYPNIKLQLKAHNNNVEKIYTVYPKGNPQNIKIKVDGASSLEVTEDGNLKISPQCDSPSPQSSPVKGEESSSPLVGEGKGGGVSGCGVAPIYLTAPVAYQEIGGKRINVSVKYKIIAPLPLSKGETERDFVYTFVLGKYNLKYRR